MIVNLYIFRKTCPLTEAEWKNRSIELCESEPQKYHCMYNRDCQLLEFCDVKKYNNFEIYLKDSGQEFFLDTQNRIETNAMQYWLIQYNIHCKPKITSTTEKPTTEQPSTTVGNRENIIYTTPNHCYAGWALFVFVSLAGIGHLIYINKRNRNETARKKDEKMKLSTAIPESTPVSGRTERIDVGNDDTSQGRNDSNDSQNNLLTD